MTATEIIDAFCLEKSFQISGDKVFPNTYLNGNEADIFHVTKSGYLYEYEIKISRSDFFAEKKKIGKTDKLNDGKRCNFFYYLVPEGLIHPEEVPEYAGLEYITSIIYVKCNKMGNYSDNPNWVEPRLFTKVIKTAPKLSSEKLGEKHFLKLMESTYRRFHQKIRDKYSFKPE